MGQNNLEITVYSDYVCPFCYLGRRSLDAYEQTRERDVTVDWQPFDLRSHKRGPNGEIDHSIEDGKDEAYFEQAKKNVARLQSKYDAEEMLSMDDLPEEIDSYNAQAASLYVDSEHPDQWLAFDEAVFDALWTEGRDIGDVTVLTAVAESVGLDSDEIRDAIHDESVQEQLETAFTRAHETGVTAVPTFTDGDHTARGAVPPAQLARLIEGT